MVGSHPSQAPGTELQMLRRLQAYRDSVELYAKECLTIRDKEGSILRLPGFNAAQRYVHGRLEQQRAETGRVRALILKGRQQGISTYIAARYYHRAALFRGVGVYILAHEQAASDNLFKMVDRFQAHNPLPPGTGVSNVKELEFNKLDSSYVVATAGQKAGGRSRTITLFHGSEVAFWSNANDHFAASVQTVPDFPGTEVLLESTGNGAGGEFYERWQDAVAGKSDYIAIFVPWWWQEEYRRPVPEGFELSSDPESGGLSEQEYASLFNLDLEQMTWRRAKVAELRSVQRFDQEYPASPEMAFQSADEVACFIKPITVLRARKRKDAVAAGPLLMGVDPSGPGKDRFAVALRQGLKILWVKSRQVPETVEAVTWVRSLVDEFLPDRVFVDLGGIGHAIVSLLKADGARCSDGRRYGEIVRGVNFGSPSQSKVAKPKVPGPKNRRAEMWDRSREWLELEEGAAIPDDPTLQADATGPRIKPLLSGDFLIESKDEMRKRGIKSPDLWDSVVLTFAELERILPSEASRARQRRETDAKRLRADDQRPVAKASAAMGRPGPDAWMG